MFRVSSNHMYKTSGLLAAIFIVGLIILLLPDKGEPVFKLNQTHGPSMIDVIGLTLMFGSWLVSCFIIISRMKWIAGKLGKRNVWLLSALYFLSIAGIIFTLVFSFEWMLWGFVVTASLINMFFVLLAFRSPR